MSLFGKNPKQPPKVIHVPNLFKPPNLDRIMANQKERPLALCPTCKYVLCSCGICHSEECLHPCVYGAYESHGITIEAGEEAELTESWCMNCYGMRPIDHKCFS